MKSKIALMILAISALSLSAEARRDQRREARQESRIAQGVESGELTKPEAKRLRRGQKRIDRAQASATADGVVTDNEKAHLEHMQDRQSEQIYKDKHNDQVRH
jgi:hypothetical protein